MSDAKRGDGGGESVESWLRREMGQRLRHHVAGQMHRITAYLIDGPSGPAVEAASRGDVDAAGQHAFLDWVRRDLERWRPGRNLRGLDDLTMRRPVPALSDNVIGRVGDLSGAHFAFEIHGRGFPEATEDEIRAGTDSSRPVRPLSVVRGEEPTGMNADGTRQRVGVTGPPENVRELVETRCGLANDPDHRPHGMTVTGEWPTRSPNRWCVGGANHRADC